MIKQILISVVSSVIASVVVVSMFFNGGTAVAPAGGNTNLSGITIAPENTNEGLIVSDGGIVTLTSTTTMAKSPDGFVAWASFTMATGTAKAVYTNSGAPLACDADSGHIYVTETTYAPSLSFSIGTSTSITAYSANLLGSTTVGTTTPAQVLQLTYAFPFILGNGQSIIASISDNVTNASSTFFGNVSAAFGIHCWTLGQ